MDYHIIQKKYLFAKSQWYHCVCLRFLLHVCISFVCGCVCMCVTFACLRNCECVCCYCCLLAVNV